MSSNKKNINNNDNNDLKFSPLNIDSSFSHNGVKFPLLFNMDCSVSLGLPNLNLTNSPMQVTPITPVAPLTPYPENVPDLEYKTAIEDSNDNDDFNLEYPSENESDILFSYNESRINEDYLKDSVNHLDILKNFDLSVDFTFDSRKDSITEEDIDRIYENIESKNSGIFATLKAYRIPYPIAKLLVKKIIKSTLDNYKG